MSQLSKDRYSAKGMAIKVLFTLLFLGLVIGGYAISADTISLMKKMVTIEKVNKPAIGALQKNNIYYPSKNVIENDKKGSSVTGSRG